MTDKQVASELDTVTASVMRLLADLPFLVTRTQATMTSKTGRCLNRRKMIGMSLGAFAAPTVVRAMAMPAVSVASSVQSLSALGIADEESNGPVDQLKEIQKLLTMGRRLSGGGRTYCISNTLRLFDRGLLEDIKFKYVGTDISSMNEKGIVTAMNVEKPRLVNVTVLKNSKSTSGRRLETAAVAIIGCSEAELIDIDVSGDGNGVGILYERSHKGIVRRARIHDMTWENDRQTNDVLCGFQVSGVSNHNIFNQISVQNLVGYRSAGFARGDRLNPPTKMALWTRGMSLSPYPGGQNNVFLDCHVSNVDQAFDVPSRKAKFLSCSATDCYTFGFKQTHNGQGTLLVDCTAERCGYCGFVFAESEGTNIMTVRDISLIDCKAIDIGTTNCTGSSTTTSTPAGQPTLWHSPKPAGYMINGLHGMYPEDIRLIRSSATDRYRRMEYGLDNGSKSPSVYVDEQFRVEGARVAAMNNVPAR